MEIGDAELGGVISILRLHSCVGARLKCHRLCKVEMTPGCSGGLTRPQLLPEPCVMVGPLSAYPVLPDCLAAAGVVDLSRPRARRTAPRRGNHPGSTTCSPCPRRVAAHQSHWRLSMGRRYPLRSGWIPAAPRCRCDHGSCRITFLVCPLSVNPAPLLWRDPN
jgi:hypothetical protein